MISHVQNGRAIGRHVWAFAGAVALMLAIDMLPVPAPLERGGQMIELTAAGKTCLGILAFAVTLWVTETIPFPVTALSVLLLIPAFGIEDFEVVVRTGFGDPIIVFFIGVLLLSAAFTRSGLGTRLAYFIVQKAGSRTDRVLFGFLFSGAMMSMWITDMAVAAIMFPLGVGLLKEAGLQPLQSNFGRTLMISCAFGPLIGGIATPAGTGANPVAIRYLDQLAQVDISFLTWMSLGLPAALMMIPLAWLILIKTFPPEIETLSLDTDGLDQGRQYASRLNAGEVKTLVVFFLTITLWLMAPVVRNLTDGEVRLSIEAVALFGGLSLFLPKMGILSWKEAEKGINWGGILLIVAGLSLGLTIYETGAARWLAWLLMGYLSSIHFALRPFVIVVMVAVLHLMFSSNTVTGTIIIPILIALAHDLNLDPWVVIGPAAFSSSLAFILVTEGPTTVIPYASGYFSIRDMAKVGIWMTLAAALCVSISVLTVGALTGSYG